MRAALETMREAETTPASRQRAAVLDELALFLRRLARARRDRRGRRASLAAGRCVVEILLVAVATAPSPARPDWLNDAQAVPVPAAPADGAIPANDTRTLLARIDHAGTSAVDLDDNDFRVWRRLTAEWHAAVYGPRAGNPDAC